MKANIFFQLAIISVIILLSNGCIKLPEDGSGGNGGVTNDPIGVWQRYGSPKGYQTDLAVGNIPGEPSNRVYMCEHPGSPSAGLYKGTISGNIITWDAIHHLPNADFNPIGNERILYFGVGLVSDAGKYKKGIWTNTCGELKKQTLQIYYRWTEDGTCPSVSYSLSFIYPNLPSNLIKGQYYGPISAGSVTINVNYSGSTTPYYVTLSAPPDGYNRFYTNTTMMYNSSVNRCNFTMGSASSLTYVDKPL